MARWFKIPENHEPPSISKMPNMCGACKAPFTSGDLFRPYRGTIICEYCLEPFPDYKVTSMSGRKFCLGCGGLGKWDSAMPGCVTVCHVCSGLGAVTVDTGEKHE